MADNSPAKGTISISFHKQIGPTNTLKRQSISANIFNEEVMYTVEVDVGSPPQCVPLVLDTGSNEIWTHRPQPCKTFVCQNASFEPSKSSTETNISQGDFYVRYMDGYFLPKATTSLAALTSMAQPSPLLIMERATKMRQYLQDENVHGIMGIGLFYDAAGSPIYPTVIDQMKQQGLISSRRFSICLNSFASQTWTVFFGGIDLSKYRGQLSNLQIQPESKTGHVTVGSPSVSLTDPSSLNVLIPAKEAGHKALIGSGMTLSSLPIDAYAKLAGYFAVGNANGTVDCIYASQKGYINFHF